MNRQVFLTCFLIVGSQSLSHKLVLIVINGLSRDYLRNADIQTPHLQKLTNDGILVENITPEFPAYQLPYLTSMLNGRHSLNNMILGEQTYYTDLKKTLEASTRGGAFWDKFKSTPNIWEINKNVGANRGSKIVAFPHAHQIITEKSWIGDPITEDIAQTTTPPKVPSNSTKPKPKKIVPDTLPKRSLMPMNEKQMRSHIMLKIGKWLKDDNINFVTMYLEEPGRLAEAYGPHSKETKEAVKSIDSFIGELVASIEATKKDTNLLIASTPGFIQIQTPTVKAPAINLEKYEKPENYMKIGASPVLYLNPLEDAISVFENFKPGVEKDFKVYSHNDYPKEWNFGEVKKLLPITLVANEGKVFPDFYKKIKELNKIRTDKEMVSTYGCNGYDNRLESMKTILIGKGPDFLNRKELEAVLNQKKTVVPNATVVDVHSLLVHLLGAKDKNGQGNLDNLSYMLRYQPGNPLDSIKEVYDLATKPKNLPVALGVLLGGSCIICLIMVCMTICCKKILKKKKADASYRYTKVQNRRVDGESVVYSADDKQSLLKDSEDGDDMDA